MSEDYKMFWKVPLSILKSIIMDSEQNITSCCYSQQWLVLLRSTSINWLSTYEHNTEAVLIIQQTDSLTAISQLCQLTSICCTNVTASSASVTMSVEQLHHFFTQVVGKHMLQLHRQTSTHMVPRSITHTPVLLFSSVLPSELYYDLPQPTNVSTH